MQTLSKQNVKVFTPADIIWHKNVTNNENRESYFDVSDNAFELHFPNKNVLSPRVDEIILLYQKVNGVPAYTHLVTPVDGETTGDTTIPARIGNANDWAHVSAGQAHTVAIRENDTLWVWGSNGSGRLGNGLTTGDTVTPVPSLVTNKTLW